MNTGVVQYTEYDNKQVYDGNKFYNHLSVSQLTRTAPDMRSLNARMLFVKYT